MRIFFVFTIFLTSLIPSDAHAQKSFGAFSQTLAKINRIEPLQNPYFIQGRDVLSRDIVDNKHKTIGDIEDIIVNRNGSIETLNVKFNRLHLPAEVPLDYKNMGIKSATNNYTLALSSETIQEIYPQLLADIAPASGGDSGLFSLQNMVGSRVQSNAGIGIGKVTEVLFNSRSNKIDALYIEISSGAMRGKGIAIPFNNVEIKSNRKSAEVTLSKVQTKAFWDFAKSNR